MFKITLTHTHKQVVESLIVEFVLTEDYIVALRRFNVVISDIIENFITNDLLAELFPGYITFSLSTATQEEYEENEGII